jgi:ABC-2 type transport system permease protein
MTALATNHVLADSAIMVTRNLRRMVRYPSLSLLVLAMPVVFLLLFVYVFGGAIGQGIGGDRADYLAYVVPGILLMTVTAVAQGTAISVAMDMTTGIVARFRTMAIARAAVLTGHVAGSLIQSVIGMVIVLAIAMLLGYRPGSAPGTLAALAVLSLAAFGIVWLAVALGLVARTVESASNLPMPLTLLPFLGSGFVPTDTMPAGLAWVARNQPFSPIIETARTLLAGTPTPVSALLPALGWSLAIALGGYLWARHLYDHRTT